MAKKEEFDILTFFIYVMILLTVVVAGFAGVNFSKVRGKSERIKDELYNLDKMKKKALDKEFRGWIARESQGKDLKDQTVEGFRRMYINRARQISKENRKVGKPPFRLTTHSQGRGVDHRNVIELPFTLQFRDCRVEDLVKYLVGIEEGWPGARVKRITKLRFTERRDGTKGWDAVVIVAIFSTKKGPGS